MITSSKNHLYIVYHKVETNVYGVPCVGDDELLIHSRLIEDMGLPILRIMDMEFELENFITRCIYEGLQCRWGDLIAE